MTKTDNPSPDHTVQGKASLPKAYSHLTSIDDLDDSEIQKILDRGEHWFHVNRERGTTGDPLAGRVLANLFFEDSTRTLASFNLAARRLGMITLNLPISRSSISKGETFEDTLCTIDAMRPDVIVVRHGAERAAKEASRIIAASVVNAGDGRNEHPTQALLDALTIRMNGCQFDGLKVVICGDIMNSRVARSNTKLLTRLGAKVQWAGPQQLTKEAPPKGIKVFNSLEEGIKGMDIVMMLRVQKERMEAHDIPVDDLYFKDWGLTKERLKLAPNAFVMHPGPMNRGVEIASDVADDRKISLILQQVEAGVAARMAVLEHCLGTL